MVLFVGCIVSPAKTGETGARPVRSTTPADPEDTATDDTATEPLWDADAIKLEFAGGIIEGTLTDDISLSGARVDPILALTFSTYDEDDNNSCTINRGIATKPSAVFGHDSTYWGAWAIEAGSDEGTFGDCDSLGSVLDLDATDHEALVAGLALEMGLKPLSALDAETAARWQDRWTDTSDVPWTGDWKADEPYMAVLDFYLGHLERQRSVGVVHAYEVDPTTLSVIKDNANPIMMRLDDVLVAPPGLYESSGMARMGFADE